MCQANCLGPGAACRGKHVTGTKPLSKSLHAPMELGETQDMCLPTNICSSCILSSAHASCTQGLRLATVTLINPDTSLREFRLVGEALVQLCPLVTVYGDRKDVALTGASIVLGIHNAYVSLCSLWKRLSL